MSIKRKSFLICLMLVALVLSTVFAVNAVDASTYSTEEVTMTVTKNGETTVRHGSFDAFMTELDSATTAENENAVITIDVNKDFQVGGKGYWEFRNMSSTVTFNLNLNGHTVTANVGNVIQVRTGYKLNVNGADASGKAGTWIATGSGASMFFVRDVQTEVKAENLNIVCTNLSKDDQPVLHFMIGDVYMKNVRVTYTGTNFPSNGNIVDKNIIKQGAGKLTLDNCILEDTSSGKLKFTAINSYSSPTVEVKNTEIKSYYAFQSSGTSITLENSKVTANAEVFKGTSTVVVTDSELITSGDVVSVAKSDVTYKYGTGKNSVTLTSGSGFADAYKTDDGASFVYEGNGKYVLVNKVVEEVTVTIVKNGVTTTKSCSFDAFMDELDAQETALSENTTYTVVMNKSFSVGGKGYWELGKMSSTATLNIDLNGHTVTSSNGNVIQVRSEYTLNMDGADEKGNIGTWRAIGKSASMFYMRFGAGDGARANIENINIVCTNLSNTDQPILHLASGITTMKNVNITYTGADFPSNGTIEDKCIIAVKQKAHLVLENCTLVDKSNGTLKFYGIQTWNEATFSMNNTTVSAYAGFKCVKGSNVITNSKITVTSDVFLSQGSFTVTDSELVTAKSTFSSTSGKVTFNYGEGKTTVTVNGTALTDNFVVEEGYGFIPYGGGKFVLGKDSGLSTVAMTSIFADGMVFQRDMPINVFGTCRKVGAEIKVTLGNETVIAVVDSTGNFKATFGARRAAKGLTLTVEQLDVEYPTVFTYNDVAIGEVIVISGQSNAAYELYKMEDAAEYIANADNYSSIKVFRAPRTYEFYEVEGGVGSWHKVTSALLQKSSAISGDVSAIGYVLATRMADELGDNVAIAIIDATYAGSAIEPWIEFNYFEEKFGDSTNSRALAGIQRYNDYVSFYLKNGRYPNSASEVSSYVEKPYSTNTPGICYNTMIGPIEGYTAKLVVWYQGEANVGHKNTYATYFDALKENFKKAFANDDLKFFAIQLAPYTANQGEFLSIQYNLGDADDTFVISTSKEGPVFNSSDLANGHIHPSRKSPVGHRVADSVLKNVYGFYADEVVEAPKVVSVTRDGNKLIVTFDTALSLSYGTKVEGFEIAGTDKNFKTAVGEIYGNTVILTADGVNSPEYVRYGFGCMQLVLKDGTVVTYNPKESNSVSNTGTDKVVIIGPDGTQYVFNGDPSLVIETRNVGNLTNDSGHPTPTFMLAVGYGE